MVERNGSIVCQQNSKEHVTKNKTIIIIKQIIARAATTKKFKKKTITGSSNDKTKQKEGNYNR